MFTSVKEYIDSFICEINDEIQWKYLKSNRELKKKINDIVFSIDFFSSKYNDMDTQIEINCDCCVWCRAYDKSSSTHSVIMHLQLLKDHEYWCDITNDNCDKVKSKLIAEIKEKIIPLTDIFEKDYKSGIQALADIPDFYRYGNSLRLFDEYLGRDAAAAAAQSYVKLFAETDKKLAEKYLNGENKLLNEHNLKYLIDNKLADIEL